MRKKRRNTVLLIVYVLLLILTVGLLMRFGATQEPETQKIGLVMSTGIRSEGAAVYSGVLTACENLGVSLLTRDDVPESDGSCPRAVAELVQEGAEMIILCSPGYSQEMEPLFSRYPSITFYGIFASDSSYLVPNLVSYSTRMYQARYLSGIVAGAYSKTGKVGFVATERTSEVCRNINAFAMGVRHMAPEAEVVVIWAAAGEEAQAARTLIGGADVDVITYHQSGHAVIDVAEEAGIASIGYYERAEGVSERCLTCAACDWRMMYEQLIREYLRGLSNTNVVNEWMDLSSGAVGLTEYSPLVPQTAIDEVEREKARILSGVDVFTNEIYDDQGTLRCGQGESMTDETLQRNIDWLVEGVRVYGE